VDQPWCRVRLSSSLCLDYLDPAILWLEPEVYVLADRRPPTCLFRQDSQLVDVEPRSLREAAVVTFSLPRSGSGTC
jgi:hypothetical protein